MPTEGERDACDDSFRPLLLPRFSREGLRRRLVERSWCPRRRPSLRISGRRVEPRAPLLPPGVETDAEDEPSSSL
jgi:hypothetical protein